MSNVEANDFPRCRNHYLLMRHGHSQANAMGLIVSSPEQGLEGYGLSPKGQEQLHERLAGWHLAAPDQVFHSDFLRTTETAALAGQHFNVTPHPEPRLRERFFGDYDQGPDPAYADVWAMDSENAEHRTHGVESVGDVSRRLIDLVISLEQRFDDATILLVGHGDPLQILLTAACGAPLSEHRSQPPLAPADVRPLIITR